MRVINEPYRRTWQANGGVFCFLGGVVAAVAGCLITVSLWIIGAQWHPWIRVLDNALFAVAIPLMLFAGFFLDWAERSVKKL
ncbi:MAG TPA: hypothetical protein VIV66_11675 [Pyrinomonadaceae bacterium]